MAWNNVAFSGTTKGTNTIALFGAVAWITGLLVGHTGMAIAGFVILLLGAGLTIAYLSR